MVYNVPVLKSEEVKKIRDPEKNRNQKSVMLCRAPSQPHFQGQTQEKINPASTELRSKHSDFIQVI
jgi:hypothetical protein